MKTYKVNFKKNTLIIIFETFICNAIIYTTFGFSTSTYLSGVLLSLLIIIIQLPYNDITKIVFDENLFVLKIFRNNFFFFKKESSFEIKYCKFQYLNKRVRGVGKEKVLKIKKNKDPVINIYAANIGYPLFNSLISDLEQVVELKIEDQ